MSVAPNQLLLYDTAITNWVRDKFSFCLPDDELSIMTGTPDRAFAEYVTVTTLTPRDGRPPLPRIAITIEDLEREPERFNSNTIRKLGYVDDTENEIRRARYPTPVRLPYTLNFWTEKYREMNLFVQQLMQLFHYNYLNIRVDLDSISSVPVYGEKDIELYAEGAAANTGDLEPGNKERMYRRTFNMHLKAWLWDFNFDHASNRAYTLKETELQFYGDRELTTMLEAVSTPKRETLIESVDGADDTFGPVTTRRLPVFENTLLVDATVNGSIVRGRDDGEGNILDPVSAGVTGTIDYVSGEIGLDYTIPPDADTDITAAYYTSNPRTT